MRNLLIAILATAALIELALTEACNAVRERWRRSGSPPPVDGYSSTDRTVSSETRAQ